MKYLVSMLRAVFAFLPQCLPELSNKMPSNKHQSGNASKGNQKAEEPQRKKSNCSALERLVGWEVHGLDTVEEISLVTTLATLGGVVFNVFKFLFRIDGASPEAFPVLVELDTAQFRVHALAPFVILHPQADGGVDVATAVDTSVRFLKGDAGVLVHHGRTLLATRRDEGNPVPVTVQIGLVVAIPQAGFEADFLSPEIQRNTVNLGFDFFDQIRVGFIVHDERSGKFRFLPLFHGVGGEQVWEGKADVVKTDDIWIGVGHGVWFIG